ncbi:Phosphate acetyltransferase [Thermovenabulum gondwanense]|uniref:Phosphate acetyltransferase n=1 Tax=Thermovenabulum gondwanense TaxID=520767 RepID=A0A162M3U1_9FIRM|nr:bifunctional enoyl-CoA hydratase/phosphate acetyltransferase [Thermovenabulum gondwanense]KYO63805.1 Phosphate acetyltransferase [Thermovenabulum gondwanense]
MIKNFKEIFERLSAFPPVKVSVIQAADEPVLEAIRDAKGMGFIKPILVGEKKDILKKAGEVGLKLEEDEILDCPVEKAAKQGVNLVSQNAAEVLMKGLIDTAAFMKAVLDPEAGLRTGELLSHMAAFEVNSYHKLLFLTDGGVNISPTLEEKISILQNAIFALRCLGYEKPKVAVLCAVETVSLKMPATVDAAIISKMAERNQIKGAIIDGPLALDNAVNKDAAIHKGIKSPVAGDADLLLVPDIEAGNALGKSLSFLANGAMAGIVLGAKAPIVLSSRADSSFSKLASIALACLVKRGGKI